jgi:phosphatidylethanolamine-binding protein (PEBP) family uncharacterized protein
MELVTGLRLEDLLETDTAHCGPNYLRRQNGYASTKLKESWKNPNYSGQSPSKQSSPYALDKMLDLKPGASNEDVDQAMQGHILL